MTAGKYVNQIVKRIKCSKNKRMEIRQQLLSELSAEVENGADLEQVLQRMGTVNEIAREFTGFCRKVQR